VESIYKDYIHREPLDTLEELKNRLQESIAALISEMFKITCCDEQLCV
jgi:hypothetical protein